MTSSMTGSSQRPATAHPDRHLPLLGTRNLRDVGGYPTMDGRHTRWRRLLRTDALDSLPDGSQTALVELGLRQAIDLRWPSEVARAPSVFQDSSQVRYRSIPLLAFEEDDPTPHLGLVGMYRRILDERGEHLVEVVRAVIAPEGTPVAIGCAAGKDRTGVAVALILSAVGVPRELVVEDYAMSAGFFARPVDDPHLVDWRSSPIETESPPEYMDDVLRHLDERHGGAHALLRSGGMTTGEIDRLVELLTED